MAIAQALEELHNLLGERLRRAKPELDAHGHSESYFPNTPPDAVAYPVSTDEVRRLVNICAAHNCPMVGWGAGTSLEGHGLAVRGGVVVDFSRMNKVLEIRPADMDVTVQPGVTREALNEELRATGLFFPVDPGANASIGGMAMTRASGTTTVRYGSMRDNVMGLQAVLADGRVIHTGSRARKSAAGYDLTAMFVGSEGTLGLVTELTLKLHGIPEATSAGICSFERIEDAVNCVQETIQMGIPMARIEFVDAATTQAFNAYAGSDMPAVPHLMVEFNGSPESVAQDADRFAEIVADHGGSPFQWSAREEEHRALWAMRHNGYYAILASRPGARAIVTDICVPISRLAQAVKETQYDIAASDIPGPILGHVGDGNFHTILLIDPDQPAEMLEAKRLSDAMAERAIRLGGTCTGEHGVGMGKTAFMRQEHGDAWDVMGSIKTALDPRDLMNPGKLVPQG
ncbi:FAD-binding oxidoreductase [Tropicibacter naphthalenivorans]|uniref:D-lactate dehydrogenase (cytochrome) n=1 Tax=Tropicibacter naphthalenivorans TaxID=441103 RepID=A0A0P1GIZ0_9RHOB|nr:FAD-linked oxidase C-terminal domain-containing protein [Tropicibacter naphthalenivorans]CUH76118.1 putative FAD-linked oxidoreductase [Tropicibacter naphthalenivorans]SMC39951.1 D-lactate dehydrogenase (cytochrome) [Tropicibacter naphthalenivorans]